MKIQFCKGKNCCPEFELINNETVKLGDENGKEGATYWSIEQFNDFIDAAKNGDFDELINNE